MRRFIWIALALVQVVSSAHAAVTRPNVVFILADDLGWSDTTLYGTTTFYKTPHIERLARRGILFNNAYTAHPLCSPTRSSIMTGLEPGRTGFTGAAGHIPNVILEKKLAQRARPDQKVLTPRSISRLDTHYITLAEAIRSAGYVTAHFGKWHLGREPYSPLRHGFDVDVPHWWGPGPAGSYVAPWRFPKELDFDPATPNQHIEDRMADEAVAFIEKNRDRPFFLNYWAFSVRTKPRCCAWRPPYSWKPTTIGKRKNVISPRQPRNPTPNHNRIYRRTVALSFLSNATPNYDTTSNHSFLIAFSFSLPIGGAPL